MEGLHLRKGLYSCALKIILALLALPGICSSAQSVSPVIVEYRNKADGRLDLTNNTLTPMVVVLEPKSFSITPDGNGVYRPLDSSIDLQLSAMSFRIEPGQTYYVFYKAKAVKLPAWFTIYAVFTAVKHAQGMDVRILLPHTVYIYPKKSLSKNRDEISITSATYSASQNTITCDVVNKGPDLDRVQEVQITSGKSSQTEAGFPLLPGTTRHLSLEWKNKELPATISLRLEHSDVPHSLLAAQIRELGESAR
jgi:hypothetical protein